MNHFILLVLSFLSIEIFIRSNFIFLMKSIIELTKKSTLVILNKNISDHWKENVIPEYSFQMMKASVKMLLILLFIIFIFLIADKIFIGFISFVLSRSGIIECLLFTFSYIYLKKSILK